MKATTIKSTLIAGLALFFFASCGTTSYYSGTPRVDRKVIVVQDHAPHFYGGYYGIDPYRRGIPYYQRPPLIIRERPRTIIRQKPNYRPAPQRPVPVRPNPSVKPAPVKPNPGSGDQRPQRTYRPQREQ